MQVWWEPPAVIQHCTAVFRSGFGFHTARAHGRFFREPCGSTMVTSSMSRRKRSRSSAMETTTASAGLPENTRRTGSDLPPMPSG